MTYVRPGPHLKPEKLSRHTSFYGLLIFLSFMQILN